MGILKMQKTIETHGDLSCEIQVGADGGQLTGILRYRVFEVGKIHGEDQDSVCAQFRAICEMVDAGGMVRHGIIMLGYHNGAFAGDVLNVDGEVIGEWNSDDEEWCHFIPLDTTDVFCSAPSPWLLHDAISDWVNKHEDSDQH